MTRLSNREGYGPRSGSADVLAGLFCAQYVSEVAAASIGIDRTAEPHIAAELSGIATADGYAVAISILRPWKEDSVAAFNPLIMGAVISAAAPIMAMIAAMIGPARATIQGTH